jgi:RNA polymerase sigma factor (sigma-70 family)
MANQKTSKQSPNERELGERFRDGNEEAFEKLFLRYEKPLYKFALGLPGMSKQEDIFQSATEVVTDAFMKAYRSRGNFKPEKKFFTWICEIAKNTFTDMLRKPVPDWKVKEVTAPPVPVGEDGEESDEDPFTYVADRAEADLYAEEFAGAEQAENAFTEDWLDGLDDDGDYFVELLKIPELTAEEDAAMEAKEDALQERIKEALATGGVNGFLKLCEELFQSMNHHEDNSPYRNMIRMDMKKEEDELLRDLDNGLFPADAIKLMKPGILTAEEFASNQKILLDSYRIEHLPHPTSLYTTNLVYQKCSESELSLREVLILYWRKYPKRAIADKLDMSEGTLKTALSRIRDKFPVMKQEVGPM